MFFGPPGSGYVIIFTGPDLDPDPSIYKQKSRKTLISAILWLLFDVLSLKTDLNVPSESNKQNNFFFWHRVSQLRKAGSGSVSHRYESADPDKMSRIHNTVYSVAHMLEIIC